MLTDADIKNKIYFIRGLHVILDKDLALLYYVKTIRLREQVKRNIKRFPSDFMFQLSVEEVDFLVSQNAIPSRKHLGGYFPYVFTEQGVASLSGVLKSDKAIEVKNEYIILTLILKV
jgi:ORF6N domain